jgi:hypothetical protein
VRFRRAAAALSGGAHLLLVLPQPSPGQGSREPRGDADDLRRRRRLSQVLSLRPI